MPHRDPEERKRYHREWYQRNKEAQREYMRNWRRWEYESRRPQAIEALGGACFWCGIDDERVLEIDHVNGGGHQERKTRDRIAVMKAIIDGTRRDEFQLLCANCHRIKTYYPESVLQS